MWKNRKKSVRGARETLFLMSYVSPIRKQSQNPKEVYRMKGRYWEFSSPSSMRACKVQFEIYVNAIIKMKES